MRKADATASTGYRLLGPTPAPCGDGVVCIPARDEARRLPNLIAALGRQGYSGARPLRVLLLINNSSDGSRQVAECAAAAATGIHLHVVERHFVSKAAHAGSARRAAMEAGADWLERDGLPSGALLTTDADAAPHDDWVRASIAALDAGADVAAASIKGDITEEARFSPALQAAVAQVLRARALSIELEDAIDPVPGDPGPRHADHTGGGLALRLSTYRAAGGCPSLPFREDLGLVDAVRRLGGVVRHSPAIRVTVSARMRGRAAGGMAATIASWSDRIAEGGELTVPDPAAQIEHWHARRALREIAAQRATCLPPDLAARVVAAQVAAAAPDPVDWRHEVTAREATTTLENHLDDLIRARDAA